jgi:pyridoxamine 5'-phosphate oxidase
MDPDPTEQFGRWFAEAQSAGLIEPNAMSLATATPEGAPSSRMVLLKEYGERGFTFFTNYGSRKGGEIRDNPRAALLFYWAELHRQVRIEGAITRVSREESALYFRERPREAQLSATASAQSEELTGPDALTAAIAEIAATFQGRELPCPENWGGYRVHPARFEFWQGRPNRQHDRLVYLPSATAGHWVRKRLAP